MYMLEGAHGTHMWASLTSNMTEWQDHESHISLWSKGQHTKTYMYFKNTKYNV